MKLLIIFPFPPPTHGFSIMGQMALEGLSQRCDTTAIDAAMDKNFSGNHVPSFFSPRRLRAIVVRLVRDTACFFSSHYDMVYMGAGMGFRGFMRYAPYMIMSILRGVPYVIHLHDSTIGTTYKNASWLQRQLLYFLLNRAAGIIVLGDSLRPILEGIVPTSKVHACKNGVDDDLFASKEELLQKHNQTNTPCRLLFLSNIMRAKGILELMEAFERIPNATLAIAGAIEPDKIIEEKFRVFLEKNKQCVKYYGYADKATKRNLYLENDLFVLPSKNEGQSVAILEAYACGCAVVTDPSVGGLGDIFTDGINGIACDHRSPKSISTAIVKCAKNLNRYTNNNILQSKEYTKEAFSERLYKILINLLKNND